MQSIHVHVNFTLRTGMVHLFLLQLAGCRVCERMSNVAVRGSGGVLAAVEPPPPAPLAPPPPHTPPPANHRAPHLGPASLRLPSEPSCSWWTWLAASV